MRRNDVQTLADVLAHAHHRLAAFWRRAVRVLGLDARHFKAQDLRGLSPDALAAAAEQMLQRIAEQSKQLDERARTYFPQLSRRNVAQT